MEAGSSSPHSTTPASAPASADADADASAGGSPGSIRDQYRSPQICPVRPSSVLNRTAKVCFSHFMIEGNSNPSAGLM
jgi:hypothetical protein